MGFEPGLPGYKFNALTTEPVSRLPDAVVSETEYIPTSYVKSAKAYYQR